MNVELTDWLLCTANGAKKRSFRVAKWAVCLLVAACSGEIEDLPPDQATAGGRKLPTEFSDASNGNPFIKAPGAASGSGGSAGGATAGAVDAGLEAAAEAGIADTESRAAHDLAIT